MSSNRLKSENSAYLKQHENNPVNWWEFGPEAIQKAKDENKPIFLSVGYSTCHWCHVMAHESFEDQETAEILNKNFISIKVDREEYPDIDNYYQKAALLFGRSGGWPLSAFLLPDMRPFFIGTYFPKQGKKDLPSFKEVLNELSRAYSDDKEIIMENAEKATDALMQGLTQDEKIEFEGHFPHPMAIMNAINEMFDKEEGGIGVPPKFPHFAFHEWALEQMLEGMIDQEFGEIIVNSLNCMLSGGIIDHLRGGIHRYSTDKTWTVPHFEKMLYDQAGLIRVLAKFSHINPSPLVFDCLMQTLDYLNREMLSDAGYFFSAQDADSEGQEGIYFCFAKDEFAQALKANEGEDVSSHEEKLLKYFNISEQGNFEKGLNVISLNKSLFNEMFQQDNWDTVRKAKDLLLEERKMRVPPATDNKGVASWNFLLVSALIDVVQYSPIEVIKRMAYDIINRCLEGVHKTFLLENEEGRNNVIRHSTTKAQSLAYFEDYVTFSEMQLRIYEVTGNLTFRDNFLESVNFVFKEFYENGKLYTRALKLNDNVDYSNLAMEGIDQSYRSSYSTFLHLARKATIMGLEQDYSNEIEILRENLTQECLRNPVASGEALRALTYPDSAFQVLKLPKKWTEDENFNKFMTFLLPRFCFDYHENDDDSWQVCTATECKLKGEGLDELMRAMRPVEEQRTT